MSNLNSFVYILLMQLYKYFIGNWIFIFLLMLQEKICKYVLNCFIHSFWVIFFYLEFLHCLFFFIVCFRSENRNSISDAFIKFGFETQNKWFENFRSVKINIKFVFFVFHFVLDNASLLLEKKEWTVLFNYRRTKITDNNFSSSLNYFRKILLKNYEPFNFARSKL